MGQPAEDFQIASFGFEGSLFDLAGEGHHRFMQRRRHSLLFALLHNQPVQQLRPAFSPFQVLLNRLFLKLFTRIPAAFLNYLWGRLWEFA